MDTEKLLIEIHGKVEATQANVTHLLGNQKCLDDKVEALHKRVDKHGKILSYASGAVFMIGIGLGLMWDWVKNCWRNM